MNSQKSDTTWLQVFSRSYGDQGGAIVKSKDIYQKGNHAYNTEYHEHILEVYVLEI